MKNAKRLVLCGCLLMSQLGFAEEPQGAEGPQRAPDAYENMSPSSPFYEYKLKIEANKKALIEKDPRARQYLEIPEYRDSDTNTDADTKTDND